MSCNCQPTASPSSAAPRSILPVPGGQPPFVPGVPVPPPFVPGVPTPPPFIPGLPTPPPFVPGLPTPPPFIPGVPTPPPFVPGVPTPHPFVPGVPTPPPFIPGVPTPPPFIPGQPGVPFQLSGSNLTAVLSQYQRPVGQPPAAMILLFNTLKSSPALLQSVIQQRPQNLQQAVQFIQFGDGGTARYSDGRILPGFCYNRWSLVFTFNDVFLMWPVANLFGFVIGYCFPFLNPCLFPDFQILFALC